NIVESFTATAYHFTVEEENDEFKWNDSISTLHNNTNGTGSSIITNYDQYLHSDYLQDVNNSAFLTSKTIVQEQELTSSNSSNYLNMDKSKKFESFTIQTGGDSDEEANSQSEQSHQVLLYQHTNILRDNVCFKFLQLIRQSQISKTSANKLLLFIKSLLPVPNSIPSNMNNLSAHLNIVDYFQKRTVCILCPKNLQNNQTKCNNCLTAETKHVAHILDTNISLLLTKIVSRLKNEI
ncbi:unnamed protein product, partial [Rotaria sp. Silwood2]